MSGAHCGESKPRVFAVQKKFLTDGCFALAAMLSLVLTLQPFAAYAQAPNRPPAIQHDPVTFAMAGESLTLKAKVTDVSPGVQDVTLYYALFRDATPFRVPMKPTGLDFYVGTIDASMIRDIKTFAYYIEATDKDGATADTPWYSVEIRKATTTPAATTAGSAAGAAKKSEGTDWKTYGLIGAGVAAVAVGAVALSGGGGGGGGGSSSNTNTASLSGTYNGLVTTCFTASGKPPTCESHNCTVVIDSKGVVFSDTLLQGTPITGNLKGDNFLLIGQITQPGVTNGVINYNGTVVNNQIVGSITGSATTSDGAGSYSGSFSASKQ